MSAVSTTRGAGSWTFMPTTMRDPAMPTLTEVKAGLVESAMDAIISVDEDQRIVIFNQAAEAVFGWPRGEALGRPLDELIPGRFRGGHRELVRRFGESGETTRRMGRTRVVMGLRRNGEEFPIEASISQTLDQGKRFYTVILRDV